VNSRTHRFALLILLLLGTALVPASASAEQMKSFRLPSPLVDVTSPGGYLQDERTSPKVNVMLPDGYSKKGKKRYPVLYWLHGGSGGADTMEESGTLDLFDGFPGIIVIPDGGQFGIYMDWWNDGERGGPAWATYHLKTLRREIEERYRIREGRRWHSLAGNSMGGQGALRYAAMLPGYFGSAAGISSALPDMQSPIAEIGLAAVAGGFAPGVTYSAIFGPREGAYAEGNSSMAVTGNFRHTRLYLTAGSGTKCPEDPVPSVTDSVIETFIRAQLEPFAEAAEADGAEVTEVPGCGAHTWETFHRAVLGAQEGWGFFKPVDESPKGWTYETIAASGDMWGLKFRFKAPPETIAEFGRKGKSFSGTGTGRVLIQAGKDCRLSVRLPFRRTLSRKCLKAINR